MAENDNSSFPDYEQPIDLAFEQTPFSVPSPVHNISLAYDVKGLNVSTFAEAIQVVVLRHDPLRTIYPSIGGETRQKVRRAEAPGRVNITTRVPSGRVTTAVDEMVRVEAHRQFDLWREPGFRVSLTRLGTDHHLLQLTVHHICFDGVSSGILLKELSTLYSHLLLGEGARLPELSARYSDFVHWQRAGARQHMSYWLARLGDAPRRSLKRLVEVRAGASAQPQPYHDLRIERGTVEQLQALARSERTTLFVVMLALLSFYLHRRTGECDFIIGSPTANRRERRFGDLIGCFASTLPIRVQVDGRSNLLSLLRRLRKEVNQDLAHQGAPFTVLLDRLRTADQQESPQVAQPRPQRQPPELWPCSQLFSVMLDFSAGEPKDFCLGPAEMYRCAVPRSGVTDLALKMQLRLTRDLSVRGSFLYGGCGIDAELAWNEARTFERLVASAAARPDLAMPGLSV